MNLRLRKADYDDMDLLFEWANDDTVRANAFHTEKISYDNHVQWFEKVMADADVYLYILCEGEKPVGQIRLNVQGGEAVIDYSIVCDQRGKGYGSEMLQMMQTQLNTEKSMHVTKIVGQVKYENRASARAFEKNGFLKKELPDYAQYEKEIE
ncbi:MAG: GNAT family N-acetyltransferase [Lachnospiraceae bacterium]|nr:GNAT family N-acetyltransferase [Lachnospiraceae bacterium]MDE7201147.1 GNAT family N-acetyltransferase [Lachnospiraceae bacterium]